MIPPEYLLVVSVYNASIPFSYYAISSPTTLQFKFTGGTAPAGGLVFNVVIPAGNWSPVDVVNFINNQQLVANGGLGAEFTATFSQQTGKFTFTNLNANGYSTTIPASPILGTSSSHLISGVSSIISDYIPSLSGTRYINILSSLSTDCITAGTIPTSSGVLASIPVSVLPGSYITYQPNILVKNILKESYLTYFDITICDSDMNALTLNGVDWEMDLLVEVIIPQSENQVYNQSPAGDLFNAVNTYHPRKYAN
jgi:hypothetical protein